MLASKIQFQTKLNVARQVIANQPSVSSAVHVGVDRVEIDMVEGVEKFTAKLQAEAFADLDISDSGNVPVERPWAKKHAGTGSSEVPYSVGKRLGIEELRNRSRAAARDSRNDVRPGRDVREVNADTSRIRSRGAGKVFRSKWIIKLSQGKRLSGLHSGDT